MDARRDDRWRRWLPLGLATAVAISAVAVGASSAGKDQDEPLAVMAAVPHWDLATAAASAVEHGALIDDVTPWWYGIRPDGSIASQLPTGLDEAAVVRRLQTAGMRVIPTVASTVDGAWAPAVVRRILHDDALRARHIDALVSFAVSRGFAGLQIDYEDLEAADRTAFTQFITDLEHELDTVGKLLYVTVHPKGDDAGYDERNLAQDYAAIGRAADMVWLMAYDWHWENGPSGPIAPLPWVEEVVRYAVTEIDPDKLLLGVALYGYDWADRAAVPLEWRDVTRVLGSSGAQPVWDGASSSTYFRYSQDGVTREVWFEDARSIEPKLDLAAEFGLAGVALWRLGGEDPAMWPALARRRG